MAIQPRKMPSPCAGACQVASAQAAAFTAPRASSHLLCMLPGLGAWHFGDAFFQAEGLGCAPTAASGGGAAVLVLHGTGGSPGRAEGALRLPTNLWGPPELLGTALLGTVLDLARSASSPPHVCCRLCPTLPAGLVPLGRKHSCFQPLYLTTASQCCCPVLRLFF